MKIALTVGHSRLKSGCYTSADGTKYGGCHEYKWCRAFSKQVAAQLRKKGHHVDRIVCPERKFISSSQEKIHKLNIINLGRDDLVIELHLNAASPGATGTEVLYRSKHFSARTKMTTKKQRDSPTGGNWQNWWPQAYRKP